MPQSPWDAQQGEAVMSGDRQQVGRARNYLLSWTNCWCFPILVLVLVLVFPLSCEPITLQLTEKCRTLIVHRDEGGYGLTLSGDRPTRVQTVKVLLFTHCVTENHLNFNLTGWRCKPQSRGEGGGCHHQGQWATGIACCQLGFRDITYDVNILD